jgi:hypothetical protein
MRFQIPWAISDPYWSQAAPMPLLQELVTFEKFKTLCSRDLPNQKTLTMMLRKSAEVFPLNTTSLASSLEFIRAKRVRTFSPVRSPGARRRTVSEKL